MQVFLFLIAHNVLLYSVPQVMRNEFKKSQSKITDFASNFFIVVLAKSVILRSDARDENLALALDVG